MPQPERGGSDPGPAPSRNRGFVSSHSQGNILEQHSLSKGELHEGTIIECKARR